MRRWSSLLKNTIRKTLSRKLHFERWFTKIRPTVTTNGVEGVEVGWLCQPANVTCTVLIWSHHRSTRRPRHLPCIHPSPTVYLLVNDGRASWRRYRPMKRQSDNDLLTATAPTRASVRKVSGNVFELFAYSHSHYPHRHRFHVN